MTLPVKRSQTSTICRKKTEALKETWDALLWFCVAGNPVSFKSANYIALTRYLSADEGYRVSIRLWITPNVHGLIVWISWIIQAPPTKKTDSAGEVPSIPKTGRSKSKKVLAFLVCFGTLGSVWLVPFENVYAKAAFNSHYLDSKEVLLRKLPQQLGLL